MYFGKFIGFVVLISGVVWLVLWLNNMLSSWFIVLLPILIGILGTSFLWKFWQKPLQDQSNQIQAQADELANLREEKLLFQSLFEQANDIVYTVDLDGVFTYVNSVVTPITGFMPHMLVGKHVSEFIKAAEDDDLMTQLQADRFQGIEVDFSTIDGRYVPLEINGRYLYINGAETAVLGIARDVTQKKQQEQALQQAKETVEQSLLIRTIFLNNMGHELRTPLSIILGYADIILQKAKQEEDTELLTLAQKVKRYTKDFSGIVNDVLRMSEIESGQVGFLLEAFRIDNVIEQAVKQIQNYLDINGNDLMLMVPPDIGIMIADRDKVRIVLVNVLSNAAKFTKNGSITLSVNRKQIAEQAWIIFHITDTGAGIPSEKQAKIFEPFSQGDNSFTKEHEGAGLGLSINQKYCQLMGGRIEVESCLGEGTTFSIYLPAEVTAVESMFVRSESA